MSTIIVEMPATLTYRAPKNGPVYTVDMSQWSEEERERLVYTLALHGYTQKIGDSAAGADSDAEAHESRERVRANLQNAVWAERGGARLDPVLSEMRGLAVQFKLMKSDAAKKATESEIAAACGAKFAALKKKAEAIVALANAPLELDEPEIAA